MLGVLSSVVIALVLCLWFKLNYSYWDKRGVPGPKPWPIVGNIGPHFLGRKTLGGVMKDIYKKYKDYPFVGIYRATKPALLVRDPVLMSHILTRDFKSFRNNEYYISKESDPIFGRNLFILRDQEWKETRQMTRRGLSNSWLQDKFPIIKQGTPKLIDFIKHHPKADSDGIETRDLTRRLTLWYVSRMTIGLEEESFESYEKLSELHQLVNKLLCPGTLFAYLFGLTSIFPVILRLVNFNFVTHKVESKIMQIICNIIQQREKNNIRENDYLQFLIDIKEEKKLTPREIACHTCVIFFDGVEAPSITLSFLLLNLARSPRCQRKLREEINEYERKNNGELTYDNLNEMPWLNACLLESLRLTPPVDTTVKECNAFFEYTSTNPDFKKITLRLVPGDVVIMHYDTFSSDEKYFSNADDYLPERMLNKEALKKTFFPFADGPRVCVGQKFGLVQVKLGAVEIVKHFKLSVSPKLQQPIVYTPYYPLNEIKGGFWIKYTKI